MPALARSRYIDREPLPVRCIGCLMQLLLIDDHALFRAGLRLLLRSIQPAADIFEAATSSDALVLCDQHPAIKVCFLDLSLRMESGFDALTQLRARAGQMAVVIVSGDEEPATIRRCIDAGAMSYIPKSVAPQVLTDALNSVLLGQVYLPTQVLPLEPAPSKPPFTPRQLEVLSYLSRGWPTKSISRTLNLSEHTVKEHIAGVFQALGARNRTEAVIKAAALHLPLVATAE
jgi:DNA-binding NarL/FixJ family response regulator